MVSSFSALVSFLALVCRRGKPPRACARDKPWHLGVLDQLVRWNTDKQSVTSVVLLVVLFLRDTGYGDLSCFGSGYDTRCG